MAQLMVGEGSMLRVGPHPFVPAFAEQAAAAAAWFRP